MHLRADSSKCSGCQACLVACSLSRFGVNNPKKARLAIISHLGDHVAFEVKTCTQCGQCAGVCPVNAILQNEKDAYYINWDECIECGACIEECPEGMIFTHPDYGDKPFECDLCGECVEICGTEALWIE